MLMTFLAFLLIALPIVLAIYAYVAYPLALSLMARREEQRASRTGVEPLVTIAIPAYNEERQIRGAIEALLAQEYPRGRLQILILSDGSTDGTDAIVQEYAAQGVELMRMPVRSGKTAVENASIPRIRGEIVVNSDASIRLHPQVVVSLVRAFADPSVGVASSRDLSVARQDDYSNTVEAGYVGYEMWVRSLETQTGGIVGASGSGYAILASLHRIPVREDLSRDFSAALTAERNGFRAVSVNEAVCFVPRTSSIRAEYKRKVRTISRGMATLRHNSELLDPVTHGRFAWKLISHKVCRWGMPLMVVPALIGIALLARTHDWAKMLLVAAALGGAVAAVGALWPPGRPMPRLLSTWTFAVAANVAVIHAMWRVLQGQDDHLWEPTRRDREVVAAGAGGATP